MNHLLFSNRSNTLAVLKARDSSVGVIGVSSWWLTNFSKRNRQGLFVFPFVSVGVIGLFYWNERRKHIKYLSKYKSIERTIDDEELFICRFLLGVVCLSKTLHVFGNVDDPVGNEHLIPENFSTFRNDRRWVFNRDRSSVEFVSVSWWEFELLKNDFERSSPLLICNDDVRRRFVDDSLGVNDSSDFLTILDRLLVEQEN